MAYLTWQVRYTITMPDGTRRDRTRRRENKSEAKQLLAAAHVLEFMTRRQKYTRGDLECFFRKGVLSRKDWKELAIHQDGRTGGKTVSNNHDQAFTANIIPFDKAMGQTYREGTSSDLLRRFDELEQMLHKLCGDSNKSKHPQHWRVIPGGLAAE